MTSMKVELLVVTDCPNEKPAGVLLRSALDDIGLSHLEFATTVIDTPQAAYERNFVGSPTILINGTDPFLDPNQAPALACRVYNTTEGLAGIPDLRDLRRALKVGALSAQQLRQTAGPPSDPSERRRQGWR